MEDLSLLTKGGSPKTVKNKLTQSSSSSRPGLEKRKDKDKKKKEDTENRESILQEGPEGHQLYRISFSTPATCVVCDKYIWGMGKAGYECKGKRLTMLRLWALSRPGAYPFSIFDRMQGSGPQRLRSEDSCQL